MMHDPGQVEAAPLGTVGCGLRRLFHPPPPRRQQGGRGGNGTPTEPLGHNVGGSGCSIKHVEGPQRVDTACPGARLVSPVPQRGRYGWAVL